MKDEWDFHSSSISWMVDDYIIDRYYEVWNEMDWVFHRNDNDTNFEELPNSDPEHNIVVDLDQPLWNPYPKQSVHRDPGTLGIETIVDQCEERLIDLIEQHDKIVVCSPDLCNMNIIKALSSKKTILFIGDEIDGSYIKKYKEYEIRTFLWNVGEEILNSRFILFYKKEQNERSVDIKTFTPTLLWIGSYDFKQQRTVKTNDVVLLVKNHKEIDTFDSYTNSLVDRCVLMVN